MAFEATVNKQVTTGSLICRFLTNLKKLGQEKLTLSTYETRLELLESYWSKFEGQHDALTAYKEYSTSDYAKNDVYAQTQESYLLTKAYMRDQIREFSAKMDESRTDAGKSTTSTKLPKISLPTFSGNYLEWESFRDLFTSLVHEAPHLTNVVRLQYLKSSVTGEAAKLISGIPTTDANYEDAWRTLVQRYENKRVILSHNFNLLFGLRPLNTESAANLKHLLDTTSECRRAMLNLGRPVQSWDDWFVYLTVQKLDPSSRKDWEVSRGTTKDMPTFEDLFSFLDSRIRALESVTPSFNAHNRSTTRSSTQSNIRSHSTSVRTPSSGNHSKVRQTCDLCGGNHYIGYCPQFKEKTLQQRKDAVTRLKLCLNCLKQHATDSCPSSRMCYVCKEKHHTLLHNDQTVPKPETHSISSAHVHMQPKGPATSTLLATAIVKVTAPGGNSSLARALLDQGSEATFISEDLTQRLHLQRTKVHVPITGLGAAHCGTVKSLVHVQLSSSHKDYDSTVSAEAYVLPHLTKTFRSHRVDPLSWPHLKGLTLSDPGSYSSSKIDLVIGADLYGLILMDGLRKGPTDTPVAQQTIFGWVLSGQMKSASTDIRRAGVSTFHSSLDLTLTEELMKFWEIEEVNQRPPLTPEELMCEEHFQKTHFRNPDGRFVVRLPKRSDVPLGLSHLTAVRSFQRNELRRLKDEPLNQAYRQFMKEYLELGHMALVSTATEPAGQSFYLPHHAVWKTEGSSSKIRVVFNASARTSSGYSLNDCLLPGPKLQQEIGHVLLRWRRHAVALTADIVKMFRQILVNPEDQPLQRILWRDAPDQELQTYQLQTVTYGTTCAPYLAIRCLNQLADDEVNRFPESSTILRTQTYVDDILFGAETAERALVLKTQLEGLVTAGGFQLAKWSSNCPGLSGNDNSPHVLSDGTIKTLGILWNPETDNFEFRIKLETPEKITKRSTLSCIAKLFDPLGWLAPVLIFAKIFIQDLWTAKCDWDSVLPSSLEATWSQYYSSLIQLKNVRRPRWISHTLETSWELHGFCDASQRAYAAVVYFRTTHPDGTIQTSLLVAKTKVAPLKIVLHWINSVPECWPQLTPALHSEEVQQQQFPSELQALKNGTGWTSKTSSIKALQPFLDSEGPLRVGGRLQNTDMIFEEKHPLILSALSSFSNLLLADAHQRTMHGGPQLSLNHLSKQFWIIRGRSLARKIVHSCLRCFRQAAKGQSPMMGQLHDRFFTQKAYLLTA